MLHIYPRAQSIGPKSNTRKILANGQWATGTLTANPTQSGPRCRDSLDQSILGASLIQTMTVIIVKVT